MSNTLIQIKRSTATPTPGNGSLSAGELAYSYNSDKLFIGSSDGTGIVEIGGLYYITNIGIGANAYATAAAAGANAYWQKTMAGANTAVGAGANAYADTVASGSGAYANATFVKLVAPNQTIAGNLAITGSLTVSGNAYTIDTDTLRVSDPLIYLAGNNYTSDIVDIGFIANYNNGSANLHTGLYREHTNKEYYLFQGYNQEPNGNHIDPTANGFTLAVLNAALKTSDLTLGGVNAISWITSAFAKANGAVQNGFVTISANGTSVVADSNNDTLSITTDNNISIVGDAGTDSIAFGLTTTGVTATTYGGADKVGRFTVDQYGRLTSAGNVSIAIDASAITSGILTVPRGGTGVGTFTTNGILYGDGTNALKVTSAGTEGQVLQASAAGVPQFGMLDGGSF